MFNYFKDINVVHTELLVRNYAYMYENREQDTIVKVVVNRKEYFAQKSIISSSSSYLR